jgi:3D-(3,5/4)-trihydroxycyclohexane-1,2-dione acylhydrolase (decyclizing)
VIVLVQNHGYASIGALSRSLGAAGFGTHYRRGKPLDNGAPAEPLPVDLAANAESLGAQVLRAGTIDELRAALERAKAADGPVVVHVEVDRYAGVPSYESWWDVPVAEVSTDESVRAARDEYERARQEQRQYVAPPRDPSVGAVHEPSSAGAVHEPSSAGAVHEPSSPGAVAPGAAP